MHRLHFGVNTILEPHIEFFMARQDDYIRTALRLPPDIHKALHDSADASGKSFNAEIIARLQASFAQDEAAFVAGFNEESERRAQSRVAAGAQQVAETMGHAKGTPELEQVVQALSEEMRAMLQKQTQELIDGFVRAGEMQKNNPEAFAKLAAIKPPTKTGKGK